MFYFTCDFQIMILFRSFSVFYCLSSPLSPLYYFHICLFVFIAQYFYEFSSLFVLCFASFSLTATLDRNVQMQNTWEMSNQRENEWKDRGKKVVKKWCSFLNQNNRKYSGQERERKRECCVKRNHGFTVGHEQISTPEQCFFG